MQNLEKEREYLKKEPGFRYSKKTKNQMKRSEKERKNMENHANQKVTIKIDKDLGFLIPKRVKVFKVHMTIPIEKEEVYARMQKAFPECKWIGEQ